jgi:hypothetical protein
MKIICFSLAFLFSLQSFEFKKFDIEGLWKVCTDSVSCDEEEDELFMLFKNGEIQFILNMGAGLDPILIEKKAKYSIEDSILITVEDELITHFEINQIDNRKINLISIEHKDTLFLTRND